MLLLLAACNLKAVHAPEVLYDLDLQAGVPLRLTMTNRIVGTQHDCLDLVTAYTATEMTDSLADVRYDEGATLGRFFASLNSWTHPSMLDDGEGACIDTFEVVLLSDTDVSGSLEFGSQVSFRNNERRAVDGTSTLTVEPLE